MKILIIEDNAANMKLTSDSCKIDGHEVLEAQDAVLGLALARSEKPDLIFMDIQLPGLDGLEATRRLRKDPETKDIPIVALTAHAMSGDEERILQAGCNAYLSKPSSYKTILATIQSFEKPKDA